MAETGAVRRHPLAARIGDGPTTAGEAVSMRALPPSTRFILRAGETAIAPLSAALGLALPQAAMLSVASGNRAALWLGPDEWLIIAEENDGTALSQAVTQALISDSVSLVDVSHRQTAIELSGPRVEDVLNTHVPLDLALSAFPVGTSTRTLLAKAEVVLWRRDPDIFHIEVMRSFAPYVWDMLREAMLEYEVV
jgi:sarcosine oxidase subunit gamma